MATEVLREGVFAIHKPKGQSSAQVIRECQKVFNPSKFFKPLIDSEIAKRMNESGREFGRRKAIKKASQVKIGHGGTLDPLATGVLILGIGSGTKVLNQFLECTKTYETIVLFGASTDTYDRVGRVLAKRPYDEITREKVEAELAKMKGKQTQIPPLYSALKMNGKPLYEYAREGKPIPREIEGREVDVKEIELLEWYEPGKHNFRWPTEEAEAAERQLAEQVWRVKKDQETKGKLSPEEKSRDEEALAAHEAYKKRFEERQDQLIKDAPPKKRQRHSKEPPMMSGALGQLPQPTYSNKGTNLVPDAPAENTPPPWSDEGPPACKVRMTVTSGFYVRSFCHDLGAKLDSAGLMSELCRSRQGDFTVGGEHCLEYDDLAKGEEVWGPKVADMLAHWNSQPPAPFKQEHKKKNRVSNHSYNHKHNKEDKSEEHNLEKRRRSQSPRNSSSPAPSPKEDPKPEKRKRSASPNGADSPRKAPALSPKDGDKKPVKPTARSESEKSWNGIED
ncbi:Fc.00g051680.m01.CDS01 [Cosmosporella sp. VM-42]